jgi:hypothetical protein
MNTGSKMQDAEGKASRKSDEIATTPMRGKTAEVTPRPSISEREQANTKKARQTMKKGLEIFSARELEFHLHPWQGPHQMQLGGAKGERVRRPLARRAKVDGLQQRG